MTSHHDSTPSSARRRARPPKRTAAFAMLTAAAVAISACAGFCENQESRPPRSQAVGQAQASVSTPAEAEASTVAARENSSALGRYSLDAPEIRVTLPRALQEVSGVTPISDTEVACIQDEAGVIFVYDLGQQKVTRQVRFGPAGDYEDIARVDSRLFVLRSDGTLFEIDSLKDKPAVRTHALGLPTANNEGLCFDPGGRRLLVAPKSRMGKGKELKDARPVYAFDLEKSELVPDPVLLIDVESIYEFAEAHGLPVPEKKRKKGDGTRHRLRFMPSSVAVHPVTSELFVLSAEDHVLATFDREGEVTGYVVLDSNVFRQPEGLAFLQNGDMLVTNEGAGKEATLLRCRWNGAQP